MIFKYWRTGIPWLVRFFGPQATALIRDWFSTKIAILDFWIFRVPFFAYFDDFKESAFLNNLQFVFYVTVLKDS
jgi:hypothetical protein